MPFTIIGKENVSIDSGLGKFTESQRHMLKLQHKNVFYKTKKNKWKTIAA